MKTRVFIAAFTCALVVLFGQAQEVNPVQDYPGGPWYAPGEILIKFKAGATNSAVEEAASLAGVTAAKHIQTAAMKIHGDHGLSRAQVNRPVAQAIEALKHHPAVESVQPNWFYTHQATPNDPYFSSLWGLSGEYGSGAVTAWDSVTGSKTVCIGVIDEGIQYNHPDLAANMWKNPGEVPNDRKDNDGNGYKDDVYGWNALNDNGTIYNSTYDDHGTHVAGTIGAVGNNGKGVVGVNWNVSIISGKFIGPAGGYTSDAIQAIDYMTNLKIKKGVDIVALNNSWGGGGYDPLLLDSIVRAAKADILFVAAAGNGDAAGNPFDNDTFPFYPSCYDTTAAAGYDSVIAVTAIDSTGEKASWANFGATTVDLGAPGVSILSTLPAGGYGFGEGTSMATPHVTGAIALYASLYPDATAVEIKQALLASVASTASLAQNTFTKGRLSIPNFLATPPPTALPLPPSGLSATAVSWSRIDLTWKDNSTDEAGFKLIRNGGMPGETIISLPANTESYSDTGLTGGTTYTYQVFAWNRIGDAGSEEKSFLTDPTPSPIAEAVFWGTDSVTQGNWIGKYGKAGYDIVRYSNLPDYVEAVTPSGNFLIHHWASDTANPRALQTPPNGTQRFLSCYFASESFTLDVLFTDSLEHLVSLYCVDYDLQNRQQKIQVFDRATGTLLHTVTLDTDYAFVDGLYLTWKISGSVILQFTHILPSGPDNAVVSGIFFDESQAPPPVGPWAPTVLTAIAASKSRIDLTWIDNSADESGFEIERSRSANSGFTRVGTVGAGVTSFSNTGLLAFTTYYYRVRAVGGATSSAYTAIESATTPRK